jgi:hypothetical protein
LPDTKGNDASQSGRDASRAVDFYLPVDQFGRVAASFQVIIGFNVMEIGMGYDEGDNRHW